MGVVPGCKWSVEDPLFLLLAEGAAVPLRQPQPGRRGEMALITAQIGFNEHVLGSEYYSTIIFIISLVTLVAPLLLKLTIRKVPGVGAAAAGTAGAEQ